LRQRRTFACGSALAGEARPTKVRSIHAMDQTNPLLLWDIAERVDVGCRHRPILNGLTSEVRNFLHKPLGGSTKLALRLGRKSVSFSRWLQTDRLQCFDDVVLVELSHLVVERQNEAGIRGAFGLRKTTVPAIGSVGRLAMNRHDGAPG
jgi:hypothetical protein